MKNKLNKLAVAVSAATLAGGAHAGIVTSSISLDQLLSGNTGNYAGAFALSPLLAANNLTEGTINSATISAFGFSDTQINQSSQTGYSEQYLGGSSGYVVTGYYSYSCGSWWNSRTCYGTNYGYAMYRTFDGVSHIEQRDTIIDKLELVSGGASATDSVDNWRSQPSSAYTGSYTRYNGTYGYDTVQTRRSTTTDAWSGQLYAELALGANDLLSLAQSGQFNFLVSALAGNFRLQGLSITLDIDPAATAAIPEPGSALLMAGGLAGLAAAARRRRRAAKQS